MTEDAPNRRAVLVMTAAIVDLSLGLWLTVEGKRKADRMRSEAIAAKEAADHELSALRKENAEATAVRRQRATTFLRLAREMAGSRHLEGALLAVDAALEDAPGLGEALLLKGRLLARQGDYSGAVKALRRCCAADASAAALLRACERAQAESSVLAKAEVMWQLRRSGVGELPEGVEHGDGTFSLGKGSPDLPRILAVLKGWDRQTLMAFVEAVAPEDMARQVGACLDSALDCRWSTAAQQLRGLISSHPSDCAVANDILASFAFAIEFAAAARKEHVVSLFSSTKTDFAPETGRLTLHYGCGVPLIWEARGRAPDMGGAIAIGRGSPLSFVVPFRPGKTSVATVRARLMQMKEGEAFFVSWRGAGTRGRSAQATLTLAVEPPKSCWVAVEHLRPNEEPRRASQRTVLGDISSSWHTVCAAVQAGAIQFRVGELWRDTVRFEAGRSVYLDLRAVGANVLVDWLEVSGPVDGVWLARQIALRATDAAEEFYPQWNCPVGQRRH